MSWRHLLTIVVITLTVAVTGNAGASDGSAPSVDRIRSLDAKLRDVLQDTREQSPTFRALVDALQQSDLIVYVVKAPTPRGSDGTVRFSTTAAGQRYVRVSIRPMQTARSIAAMLAHELQHVREVADAPSVQDARGMSELFARIGVAEGWDSYETNAARDMAEQVLKEIDDYARTATGTPASSDSSSR